MSRPIFEVNRPIIKVGDVARIRHESGVYAGFVVVGTRPNWLKVRTIIPTKAKRYGFIHIGDVDAIERGGFGDVVYFRPPVMVEGTGA
jgi:hypothetical protein